MQRPGLLLLDGVVYAGFASHCDRGPCVGYVVGVDAKNGKQTAMFATETGSSKAGAGIWQSGGGLVSDGKGQIIFATGNGVSPSPHPGKKPPSQLAESVVRVGVQDDGTLKATDFFSPVNNSNLDTDDTDLGSGGPMAILDGYGTDEHPHLLVEVGKDGRVFLLDRDDLGGSGQKTGKDDVLQTGGPYKGVWGYPAFWGGDGGYVYMTTNRGPSAFMVGVSGSGKPAPTRTGTTSANFGYTSGSPMVTSNGKASGSALVWTVYSRGPAGDGGQLRACDVTVPITGTSIAGSAQLTIAPGTLQFGAVQVGKSVTKTFDITNTGNLLLTLTKAAPPTEPFLVPDPVSEGQQIEPGDVIHQSVTYTPTKVGAFNGTYSITGNDGQGAHLITVHGTAVVKPVTHAITGLGKCVDVRQGKTANGTAVQLYSCNGSEAQDWAVGDKGALVNTKSGRCLDVPKGVAKNKVQLQIYNCNGSAAQGWSLDD